MGGGAQVTWEGMAPRGARRTTGGLGGQCLRSGGVPTLSCPSSAPVKPNCGIVPLSPLGPWPLCGGRLPAGAAACDRSRGGLWRGPG